MSKEAELELAMRDYAYIARCIDLDLKRDGIHHQTNITQFHKMTNDVRRALSPGMLLPPMMVAIAEDELEKALNRETAAMREEHFFRKHCLDVDVHIPIHAHRHAKMISAKCEEVRIMSAEFLHMLKSVR